MRNLVFWFKSRAGHVKSGLNTGGPSPKAKYSWLTDSEQVPWGKGEKNPETEYLQAVRAGFPVMAYLLYNEPTSYYCMQA